MVEALLLVLVLAAPAVDAGIPPSAGSGSALQEVDTSAVVDDAELEAMTRRIASQLRCPVCQGLSIEDSPTDLAQNMRSVVRDQLAEGRTPDEVKAYFVSRYGEWILLAPEPSGFNLTIYLLPVLAVLAGGIIVGIAIRRWSSRPATTAGTDTLPIDEPELEPWDEIRETK